MDSGSGPAAPGNEQLKPFLASALFVLPWISWQAWVLGSSFRQRRGELVREKKTKSPRPGEAGESSSAAAAASGAASTSAPALDVDDTPAGASPNPPDRLQDRWRPAIFVIGVTSLFLAAQAWLSRVLTTVPEPYLDEIFHIPQAQRYCEDKWLEWDDKITTPPGLYIFSYVYKEFWSGIDQGCSVWGLRAANTIAIMLVAIVACSCRAEIEHQQQYQLQVALDRKEAKETASIENGEFRFPRKLADNMFSLSAFHTALNIALFPVLFFFSALYYTDVYSTLITLAAYRNHLFRRGYRENGKLAAPPPWSSALTVVLGLLTLLMRQTNIFWVVVYIGGLEAVGGVKSLRQNQEAKQENGTSTKGKQPELPEKPMIFDSPLAMVRHYVWQYSLGDIHDPPVGQSWPDDWVLSLLSIAIAGVCNPAVVLLHVWPYVVVLASFVGFVAWNGGVVLGDKSNHVATIHLAQMLYIWPLFAFFSAPLFASHGLHYLQQTLSLVAGKKVDEDRDPATPQKTTKPAVSQLPPGPVARLLQIVFLQKAYYPLYLLAIGLAVPLAIVHFNTIIHPFTLADNRHYMFYVFRYTIRRAAWIRYALVPVYAVSAWACWRVLWGRESKTSATVGEEVFINSPFVATTQPDGPLTLPEEHETNAEEDKKKNRKKSAKRQKTAKAAKNAKTSKGKPAAAEEDDPDAAAELGDAAEPVKNAVFLSFLDEEPAATAAQADPLTSEALLWLLATGLSLVTAPLVEPRYFILPWVFWRLLVPAVPTVPTLRTGGDVHQVGGSSSTTDGSPSRTGGQQKPNILVAVGQKLDIRLVLETVWHGAVLLATMHVFLYRPYEWRAEDGTVLDDGRLQRFMW